MNDYRFTVGELFSGIGGFSIGSHAAGFKTLWAAELDERPKSVMRRHFPRIKYFGDITKINVEEEIEHVPDVVVWGFPCQDVSQSGKRQGFTDIRGERTRSGLFHAGAEFISRLRNRKDSGGNPKFSVFENVPGLLTHDKGGTFQTVLDEMGKIGYPVTGWVSLNARYFGVPQNRERVFGISASDAFPHLGEILSLKLSLIAESLRRDIAESGTPGEDRAGEVEGGVGGGGQAITIRTAQTGANGSNISDSGVSPVVDRTDSLAVCQSGDRLESFGSYKDGSPVSSAVQRRDYKYVTDIVYTPDYSSVIRSGGDGGVPSSKGGEGVIAFEHHGHDSRTTELGDHSPGVTRHWGTGGNNTPLAVHQNTRNEVRCTDISGTITTGGGKPGQGYPTVFYQDGCSDVRETDQAVAVTRGTGNDGGRSGLLRDGVVVRRFSETEIEKIMGFPIGWTEVGIDENGKTTVMCGTNRRKMLGNAVVPNVVEFVMGELVRPCLEFVEKKGRRV